jgi:hypothetical protein
MTFSAGACLGPVIGGFLEDVTDFRTTTNLMAFSSFGVFVFFTVASLIIKLSAPEFIENETQPNDD